MCWTHWRAALSHASSHYKGLTVEYTVSKKVVAPIRMSVDRIHNSVCGKKICGGHYISNNLCSAGFMFVGLIWTVSTGMGVFRVRVSCGWSLKLRSAWSLSLRTRWVHQTESRIHKNTKTVCQPDPLSVSPSICIHLFSCHSVGSSIFFSVVLSTIAWLFNINISNSVPFNQLFRKLRKSTI